VVVVRPHFLDLADSERLLPPPLLDTRSGRAHPYLIVTFINECGYGADLGIGSNPA